MNCELKKHGFTLAELLVAAAIIAMLVIIAIPSARALHSSYESTGAESMISSALSTARAIAAKEQRYAGIRFQKAWQTDNDGPQYMIFIVNDYAATGIVNGFHAVDGLKPVKLPANIGVMDLSYGYGTGNPTIYDVNSNNAWLNNDWPTVSASAEFCDTTTFSIVFSPTGKLIIHDVRVRNRDGKYQPDNSSGVKVSYDDVFNSAKNIKDFGVGMFIQDDYTYSTAYSTFWLGLYEEPSRSAFVIFDKEKLKNAKNAAGNPDRWFSYLQKLPVTYINPYTGTMIEK